MRVVQFTAVLGAWELLGGTERLWSDELGAFKAHVERNGPMTRYILDSGSAKGEGIYFSGPTGKRSLSHHVHRIF
jgi:hypothetical protein